jgi:protein-S-isoprenylcysteine O-methyltransferase Ste14
MSTQEKKPMDLPKSKIALRAVIGIALLLIFFFGPAGTFRWPQAWVFLVSYLSAVALFFFWTKRRDPGLLKERMGPTKKAKAWDQKILWAYTLFLAAMPVVAGLDAVRFRWTRWPLGLNLLGFAGLGPAMLLVFGATKANPYASSVMRIQRDRGQRVCASGPYAYVRHPMYIGIILIMLCLPLALGSRYAFIPAGVIIGLFILRTELEDKTLQEELPGYREYAQTVHFRLIPGIW